MSFEFGRKVNFIPALLKDCYGNVSPALRVFACLWPAGVEEGEARALLEHRHERLIWTA